MFGDYLKQVRNSLNLTQNELAVRLNLADEEFRSLDVVTLSRWERGKTKPALAKCFRILRCLQTDLSEFYNLIPNPNETKLIDEFFKLRFERQFVRISSANYENKPKSQAELIIEHPLLLQDNDEVISNLRNFYETAKYIPNGLFDINLYDYQINRRAILKRFTTQDGVLIGHSLSFIFESEYFDKAIHAKNFHIDLTKTVSYRNTNKLAVCNYNRYCENKEVFRCMLVSQYVNIIKHSNVQRYYFFKSSPESGQYLESLGFKKVAFETESDSGGFKLGSRRFESCLYEIDTATLLSHPAIITLIKTTQWDNKYSNHNN